MIRFAQKNDEPETLYTCITYLTQNSAPRSPYFPFIGETSESPIYHNSTCIYYQSIEENCSRSFSKSEVAFFFLASHFEEKFSSLPIVMSRRSVKLPPRS